MVKELSLAIILGGFVGFLITGGVLGLKSKKPSTNQTSPTPVVSISQEPTKNSLITPTSSPTIELEISSPENESVVSSPKINIEGTTTPKATIIVKTEKDTYAGSADASGQFKIPVELEAGINNVQVTSIDDKDFQKDTEIMITYSTAKI